MTQIEEGMAGKIHNAGKLVPVVVFYSVQGGVGKSTLASKFAELVTMAPGREEHNPNVLLVDLDVGAQGLTFRMAGNVRQNYHTIHDAIRQRDASMAQAIPVTGAAPVTSTLEASRNGPGAGRVRGQRYLVPAAPPGAVGLYDVAAGIDKKTLVDLLTEMIQTLVHTHDIACVVIDCPPGLDPYTAAAAAIADRPLLIGRNEETSFQQIWELPDRFREWYSEFQPARQRVIINAVAVTETFGPRSKRYSVLDYIPLVSEVIQDTEGIPEESRNDFRMLLFEKWVIDIIQKVLHGMDYLIPNAPDVLGEEWADTLRQLNYSERAPAIRRLRLLGHLRWAGAALAVLGVVLVGVRQVVNGSPASLTNWGILATIAGLALAGIGWYAEVRRQRTLSAARALVMAGPDGVFKKIQGGESDRKDLEDLKKIADSVPKEPEKQPTSDPHVVTLRLGGVK
jgi:MinD-like ATPase involved in chromosome partitioning or flagellar assembly